MKRICTLRNDRLERYEIEFTQDNGVIWTRYLDDYVHKDPIRFANWIKTLLEDLKIRQ